MKKLLIACFLLISGQMLLNAQDVKVSPKHFDKGKKVTFTFSGSEGMQFTQGSPSYNMLSAYMYIIYTSASSSQGTNTSGWYNQGSDTYNWYNQATETSNWYYQGTSSQGSYTQGSHNQGSHNQGSYTQGTSTYCRFCWDVSGTSTLKSDEDCTPAFDGFLSPLNVTMIDSKTLKAEFDFPSYLSVETLDIIFDNGEHCPYIMSNSIVMLGMSTDEPVLPGLPSVTVYPNPFSTELHFDFDQEYEGLRYEISNMTGTFRKAGTFSGAEESLDLSNFSDGSYIVTVLQGNKVIKTETFLKR